MLAKQKIIPQKDSQQIVKGLSLILKDVISGKFKFDPTAEDIHSNIQELLNKKIGEPAHKLHTARSRNDQVALDVRMYLKNEIDNLNEFTAQMQKAILKFALTNSKVVIPGYTHLQIAQCVLLAHHLLAYVEALERDKQRLLDAKKRINSMRWDLVLFSGTGLNIDRDFVKKELKFATTTVNSIDSVSDRDYIIEVLAI